MKNMEETLSVISENIDNKKEETDKTESVKSQDDQKETTKDTTEVDTVSGNVTTIKEEDVVSDETPTSTPKKVAEKKDAANSKQIYVVEKGDTLASISKKVYNSSKYIDKIMSANDIEDQDKIYAGQKLIMP
jgi:nucleoid-associated protein YgaU